MAINNDWYVSPTNKVIKHATHTFPYDAQTGNFTLGDILTGGGSGAKAIIVNDADGGSTGTLDVVNVSGTFQDNETITDQHTGSATSNIPTGLTLKTTTYTVNALYTYLLDYFDEESTIQYLVPMSAQTPSEYTLLNGWLLDDLSNRFLSGGAITTSGWNGAIQLLTLDSAGYTSVSDSDLYKEVGYIGGSPATVGTLLDYDNTLRKWWVRGATSFTDLTTNLDLNGAGDYGDLANSSTTGETIWSNIFSLGTLVAGTTLDVYQNDTQLTSPWWSSGHIDILVKVKESGTEIDSGNITVLARLYGTLYDHYLIDASTGRNPVPLAAFDDGNNDTASGTVGAYSGFTFTFGYASKDLGNGNGLQPYDCVIECNSHTLLEIYEYLKYVTRTGSSTTLNGVNGEFYAAVGDVRFNYDTEDVANFSQGERINGTGGTYGYLVSLLDNGNNGTLVLRNVHGTFIDNMALTGVTTGTTALVDGSVTTITPSKQAPFGTYAGGQFFGARGVWLDHVASADANNYDLIDSTGAPQSPPTSVSITINNTVSGDRVSVFIALDASGNIHTTYLTSDNTANAIGDTTFVIDSGSPIPTDTPATGVLRVVDQPGQTDHRYRYLSWTGLTFTLITTGVPTGTVDTVSSNSSTGFRENNADLANIFPGDMIRNSTDLSWAHVLSVTLVTGSTYDVLHTPLRGGTNNFWTVGDGYRFNQLVVGYNSTDKAYVPYIDKTATGTSTSVNVPFSSTRNISARVRRKGIQPYTDNITELTSAGYSTSVTRIPDDITT